MAVVPPKPPPTIEEIEARIRNAEERLEKQRPTVDEGDLADRFEIDDRRITTLASEYAKLANRLDRLELRRSLITAAEIIDVPASLSVAECHRGTCEATIFVPGSIVEVHELELAPLGRDQDPKELRIEMMEVANVVHSDGKGGVELPAMVSPTRPMRIRIANMGKNFARAALLYRYLVMPKIDAEFEEDAESLKAAARNAQGKLVAKAFATVRDGMADQPLDPEGWIHATVPAQHAGIPGSTSISLRVPSLSPNEREKIVGLDIDDVSGLAIFARIVSGRFDLLTRPTLARELGAELEDRPAGLPPVRFRRFDLSNYYDPLYATHARIVALDIEIQNTALAPLPVRLRGLVLR